MSLVGLPTANAARRIAKQVERLRNNLAHAQAFAEQDWPQIVRLARRVDNLSVDRRPAGFSSPKSE